MKINAFVRRANVLGLFLCLACTTWGQSLKSSYFMDAARQRLQLNPALTPYRGFVGIPLLSTVEAGVYSSNGIALEGRDYLKDSRHFYDVWMNRPENSKDYRLSYGLRWEFLSAGWFYNENFWSVHVGLRALGAAKTPGNFFRVLGKMENVDWRNIDAQFGQVRTSGTVFSEVGVGYARPINERITVGGRVNVLVGGLHSDALINNLHLSASLPSQERLEQLRAQTLYTEEQARALKAELATYHASYSVDADVHVASKSLELTYEGDKLASVEERKSLPFPSGYGVGLDVGVSFAATEKLNLSASLLDLGMIWWGKQTGYSARIKSSKVYASGAKYAQMIDLGSPETVRQAVEALEKDIESYRQGTGDGDELDWGVVERSQVETGRVLTSGLAPTLVLGGEYMLWDKKLSVGGLFTTRFFPSNPLTEFTLSLNYRPNNFFNATLSHSVLKSIGRNLGAAVKVGWFFLGSDYVLMPREEFVNVHLGVSVPLGKRKPKFGR